MNNCIFTTHATLTKEHAEYSLRSLLSNQTTPIVWDWFIIYNTHSHTFANDWFQDKIKELDVNGYTRIGTNANGGLGINTLPGYYSLDVNGNFRVSDGYGVLTFANSGTNSVTSISNTDAYPSSSATLQVTGGYFSSNGTTGASNTTSVPFKKGMFILSATSNTTRHGIIGLAWSTSAYTLVSSNSNTALITADGSTIVVASGAIAWNITYFPTP